MHLWGLGAVAEGEPPKVADSINPQCLDNGAMAHRA
jgi:hypothetical protein